MVRVWYSGESISDNRLPGVRLEYGTAVDVSDEIAGALIETKDWSLEKPAPKQFVEVRRPEWRRVDNLVGVGKATGQKLKDFGFGTIGQFASMSDEDMEAFCRKYEMSVSTVRSLRDKARAQI